jgi:hypothetical protein
LGFFKSALRSTLGAESAATRGMLSTSQRIRLALQDPLLALPVPLLHPDKSLLVLWSAKSACSLTFVWYLKTVGLLDDYRASGFAPHEYRGKHYLESDVFARGRRKLLDDYYVVHVIRDPYLRAVSCYRHVLARGFADKRFKAFEDGALDRHRGFSFSRYLDFLETLDLARTNLHHRQQLHQLERIKSPDRVINVSKGSFLQELNLLERELSLPLTNFADLGWLLKQEERRRAKTTAFDGDGVADLPLNAAAAAGHAPWPNYEQFLAKPMRRRIERLYAADFKAFGQYMGALMALAAAEALPRLFSALELFANHLHIGGMFT